MIEMRVRHQDEIDLWKLRWQKRARRESKQSEGRDPGIDADAGKQRRIGEDSNTVEVDQHGGVTEPRERNRIVWPAGRRGCVRCRLNLSRRLEVANGRKE